VPELSLAARELQEFRTGTMTLAQLADTWAKRRWNEPALPEDPDARTDYRTMGLWEPGTWGEVEWMRASGKLTTAEYRTISRAADAAHCR
jgi:hypothetical protein